MVTKKWLWNSKLGFGSIFFHSFFDDFGIFHMFAFVQLGTINVLFHPRRKHHHPKNSISDICLFHLVDLVVLVLPVLRHRQVDQLGLEGRVVLVDQVDHPVLDVLEFPALQVSLADPEIFLINRYDNFVNFFDA